MPNHESVTADAQREFPRIIQGGMGIGISGWQLAKAVSRQGQLGVVSGTALNVVFAQRLQSGDEGGHLRRALEHFPDPEVAAGILKRHFNRPRKSGRSAVHGVPMFTMTSSPELVRLTIAASFCEVWLAKEGHHGVVGINLLEKVQLPNLASLYGAMLAGVDYVLMGAGIPKEIPGALDQLSMHEAATLRIAVQGASDQDLHQITLEPKKLLSMDFEPLKRPRFLAIISSEVLAEALLKRANGTIDGFVIENNLAGGHNAPPRGALRKSESGEPIYGPRDSANLKKIRALGLPFWVAGDVATPHQLQEALELGAQGIQVGTPFAFCEESGLAEHLKREILEQVVRGTADVFTDPNASPTGFPFKVVQLEHTLSDEAVYQERPRLCQLGYLRQPYQKPDGDVGFRCPGEPIDNYLRKGGNLEDTIGRKCLCNALMANVGLPQEQRSGYIERPLVTAGNSLLKIRPYLTKGGRYSASDVLDDLLEAPHEPAPLDIAISAKEKSLDPIA